MEVQDPSTWYLRVRGLLGVSTFGALGRKNNRNETGFLLESLVPTVTVTLVLRTMVGRTGLRNDGVVSTKTGVRGPPSRPPLYTDGTRGRGRLVRRSTGDPRCSFQRRRSPGSLLHRVRGLGLRRTYDFESATTRVVGGSVFCWDSRSTCTLTLGTSSVPSGATRYGSKVPLPVVSPYTQPVTPREPSSQPL